MRNRIKSLLRSSKKLHYKNYFTENSKNVKKTWKGIKNIINMRKSLDTQFSSLFINGEISSDPTQIANSFNDYFSDIGDKLQSKIHSAGVHFSKYLGSPNKHNFLFDLSQLIHKKSHG